MQCYTTVTPTSQKTYVNITDIRQTHDTNKTETQHTQNTYSWQTQHTQSTNTFLHWVQPTCTCVLALVGTTTPRSHIAASIAISTHAPTPRGFEIIFCERSKIASGCTGGKRWAKAVFIGISGLVVEYIVAIDMTRVRFPADAFSVFYDGTRKTDDE